MSSLLKKNWFFPPFILMKLYSNTEYNSRGCAIWCFCSVNYRWAIFIYMYLVEQLVDYFSHFHLSELPSGNCWVAAHSIYFENKRYLFYSLWLDSKLWMKWKCCTSMKHFVKEYGLILHPRFLGGAHLDYHVCFTIM